METNPLRQAYDALLATVPRAVALPAEWNTVQILAHVSLVSAATVSTVAAVGAGSISTYDNASPRIRGRWTGRARGTLRRPRQAPRHPALPTPGSHHYRAVRRMVRRPAHTVSTASPMADPPRRRPDLTALRDSHRPPRCGRPAGPFALSHRRSRSSWHRDPTPFRRCTEAPKGSGNRR